MTEDHGSHNEDSAGLGDDGCVVQAFLELRHLDLQSLGLVEVQVAAKAARVHTVCCTLCVLYQVLCLGQRHTICLWVSQVWCW